MKNQNTKFNKIITSKLAPHIVDKVQDDTAGCICDDNLCIPNLNFSYPIHTLDHMNVEYLEY